MVVRSIVQFPAGGGVPPAGPEAAAARRGGLEGGTPAEPSGGTQRSEVPPTASPEDRPVGGMAMGWSRGLDKGMDKGMDGAVFDPLFGQTNPTLRQTGTRERTDMQQTNRQTRTVHETNMTSELMGATEGKRRRFLAVGSKSCPLNLAGRLAWSYCRRSQNLQ